MLTGVDVALSPYKVTVGNIPKWRREDEGEQRKDDWRVLDEVGTSLAKWDGTSQNCS